MENKSLQILQNVKDITVEIINLIGEENDAIIAKDFKSFKSIIKPPVLHFCKYYH